mgnify:CR=1 FL=1
MLTACAQVYASRGKIRTCTFPFSTVHIKCDLISRASRRIKIMIIPIFEIYNSESEILIGNISVRIKPVSRDVKSTQRIMYRRSSTISEVLCLGAKIITCWQKMNTKHSRILFMIHINTIHLLLFIVVIGGHILYTYSEINV